MIEIYEPASDGYAPLLDSGGWRVAALRYAQRFDAAHLARLERHRLTDEVFVLLAGAAVLLGGGQGEQPASVETHAMLPARVYNIPRGEWHHILADRDAVVLIVENADTSSDNSDYAVLDGERLGEVRELLRKEGWAQCV